MYTYKHIFFYILCLIAIPFQVITAQDTQADSTQINEIENRYDSIISKAALSLTSAQYKQASDYYKAASLIKPQEMYPHKMIKYVETIMTDEAAKQKRAEELTQRAQIKNDLFKANTAIVNGSWDSARILFSEILTLNPGKTDSGYAKSKIEAIDLELKRIALRTPPKPEPIVIAPPKNRSEARARRKMAERNAVMAALAAQTKQQTPPALPQRSVAAAPVNKEITQKPIETPLPQKAQTAPAIKEIPQKPIEVPSSQKTVVTSQQIKDIPQKPIEVPSTQKTVLTSQQIKDIPRKPIEVPPSEKKVADAPAVKETVQKTIEEPPMTQITVEPPKPQKTVEAAPANKVTEQKPVETQLPQKNVVTIPATKEVLQKPNEASLPKRNIKVSTEAAQSVPQKPAENSASPTSAVTAPFDKEVSTSSTGAPLLNLADSSNYIKLICQDISFIGTNAYVKVLIQNYSETASFLTDTLQVSIKKNNGILTKLDQRFISSFPIVAPLKELILVSFADASVGVEPNDIFILEMKDKTKKTTLALQIPWALYKQQKNL